MRRLTKHIVPAEKLADKLVELLTAEPCTADDLARLTGYTVDIVRTRLNDLRRHGRVSCKSQRLKILGGLTHVWHPGAITTSMPAMPRARDSGTSATKLHQVTTKAYPPYHHRDSLVAALFGPAPQESA